MKKYIVLAGFICLFITSCIPSLHPIFTEENRITDDRLIGFWVDSEDGMFNKTKRLEALVKSEFDRKQYQLGDRNKDSLVDAMTKYLSLIHI